MPTSAISFKIELLCQLPKPRFEATVPFGDNWCFLVCRQNVAKIGAPLLAGYPVVAYTGWFWRHGPGGEVSLAGNRGTGVSLPVSTLSDS
jgi:hypothetical protein